MKETLFRRINNVLIHGEELSKLQIVKRAHIQGKEEFGNIEFGLKELKDGLDTLILRGIIVHVPEASHEEVSVNGEKFTVQKYKSTIIL